MKDVGVGLGVKNISDLILKEIYGIYEKKELTKEEIQNYKMIEREIFKKFDNLNKDELNTKSNKSVYVKKMLSWQILLKIVEVKKKGIKAIDGFRKKLIVLDYEISVCPEHDVKSKIGTIFVNEEILEENSVKIYEINPYFHEHYHKKIHVENNDQKYVLFRIDVYFAKYSLAVEIDEKRHTNRDHIFEEKRQKTIEEKLNCKFIRIDTSNKNYDADYGASRIQNFISKFKNKEKENEVKNLEDEINKSKLQLTNLCVENNVNDK